MIRLQSSLGKLFPNYRPDMFMDGYMALARVTKVHHYSGTADVVLINNNNKITSNPINQGRFAARIGTSGANLNSNKNAWGEINPIDEGSLVLVAFMENMKKKPIIICSFHMPDNGDNVLHPDYPLNPSLPGYHRREALKYLRVYPAFGYEKIDGEGNVERVHPSKSFLRIVNTAGDPNSKVSDNHLGYDHKDLTEINKRTNKVIEADNSNAQQPSRLLYVNRRFDLSTGWTKLFQDEFGMTRFTRDNNDGMLSYIAMNHDGSFKIRRQQDNFDHEKGTLNTEVRVNADGTVNIQRTDANGTSSFVINSANEIVMTHESGSFIKVAHDITIHPSGTLYTN